MAKSYKEDENPAYQFYVDDWLSDPGLRLCSLAARGLWKDMLCWMHKSKIRGTLLVNGKQIQSKWLARLEGENEDYIKELLKELEDNVVFSRLEDETIINRRMYYKAKGERELKQKRMDAGRLGGLAKSKQGDDKEDSKKQAKPPSSSSSPSSSPTPKLYSPTSEKVRLAKLLFSLIRERKPNYQTKIKSEKQKEALYQKWADHIDKLIRIDERGPAQIEAVIRWCQKDDFWKDNILSTEKLREKIDKLELKMAKPEAKYPKFL